jgi:hypothetical protein
MKTLILATVNYGNARITQSWEILELGPERYIVLHEVNDGKIAIRLAAEQIKDMSKGIIPEKFYNGVLNASEAENLTPSA